jgi:hypothetical protein
VAGFDAETWLIDHGSEIVDKKQDVGVDGLEQVERLVLYLWYVDYCMRNGGDLENLDDMCPDCLTKGAAAADALQLPNTHAFFARPSAEFARHFFADFDDVVAELSQANGSIN